MIRKLWLSLSVAFVALLPHFYLFLSENNRYVMKWSRADHFAVLAAILLLGLLYFGAYVCCYRVRPPQGRSRRLFDLGFCVLMTGIMLRTMAALFDRGSLLPPSVMSMVGGLAFKVVAYLVLPSLACLMAPRFVKTAIQAVYLMVSPLLIYVIIVPLTYVSHNPEQLPPDLALADRLYTRLQDQPDVLVFIFDEWSYERTFSKGAVSADMPALQELVKTSTVFHEVFSPGKYTWTSVPKFLLQSDPEFVAKPDDMVMKELFARTTQSGRTIFEGAGKSHYKVALGFAMEYEALVGHETDCAMRVRHVLEKLGFAHHVKALVSTQTALLRFVGLDVESLFQVPRLSKAEIAIGGVQETHRLVKAIFRNLNASIFLFAHYQLPKNPFVWDRDGVRQRFPSEPDLDFTVENYAANLRYLDVVIGDIVQTLKEEGRFDDTLLILTSDHGWRCDPEGPLADSEEVSMARQDRWHVAVRHEPDPLHPWKRVPLIVKFPKQQARQDVQERVFTMQLHTLIDSVLAGNNDIDLEALGFQ